MISSLVSIMNRNLSPIERLPAELLSSILDYVPQAVFAIRSASKILKVGVDSYASKPKIIRLVERLDIMTQNQSITFSFDIPIWRQDLFELRLRLSGFPCESFTRDKYFGIAVRNVQTYRLIFHDTEDIELLSRLAFTMGGLPLAAPQNRGTLGSVQIMMLCDTETRLWRSSKILEGMNFEILAFTAQTLKDARVQFLCTIIDAHNVDRLDLVVAKNVTSDPKGVLLEFSSRLRSLLIRQVNPYHQRGSQVKLFFGDLDWPSAILEMFSDSRKLDKLFLDGYQNPDFITSDGDEKLRVRLPKLRKRVWFTAKLPRWGEGFDYTVDGYVVKGTSEKLEIKHSSRGEYY